MRFKYFEPNTLANSLGRMFQFLGRKGIRFVQEDRAVWIDSEALADGAGFVVYRKGMRVERAGMGNDEVTSAEVDRIVEILKAAFADAGIGLELV